ncbi:MAG: HNH endonuclease [Synechococcus sp. SB0669_bin_7]|nr:HNH endonuclease [Synechococcus sp. SB0669_bin_7]
MPRPGAPTWAVCPARTHRHRLYGQQEGICAGCGTHFLFRVMEVDHILPRARGGTDHPDNLQLLCSGTTAARAARPWPNGVWMDVQTESYLPCLIQLARIRAKETRGEMTFKAPSS